MKNSLLVASILSIVFNTSADVIMTGIIDGDLSGGTPKAIELYVQGTEDLSGYSLQRSANGAAFNTSFDLSGIYTDEFVYLVGTGNSGISQFESVFGTAGDFANVIGNSTVSGNGNDAFRLLDDSDVVVDQVWQEDATYVYQDSYMYRKNGTGPDSGWESSNWMMAGNSILDGLNEAAHEAAIPFGTYAVPEPLTISFVLLFGTTLLVSRRFFAFEKLAKVKVIG